MYKKCYHERIGKNKYLIHLFTDKGYEQIEWDYPAFKECSPYEAKYKGIKGEPLKKVKNWDKEDPKLHFHDIPPYQRFLIDKYGIDDKPSKTHREVFFDIEIEMGEALTEEYIRRAPKKVTSIAWYYKQEDKWEILILDKKDQIKHIKAKNKEITPYQTEKDLLIGFIEKFREINPDIIVGWNSDYFDIPYLYYRICNVFDEEIANYLSPINKVRETPWMRGQYIQIMGVESLDYMKLHQKYSFSDEPSYKLDIIGEKYVGIKKIEYEGNLDTLFEKDINKFIQYNFRDVEILKLLDKKLDYINLTKNISHKGKHNYSEVYTNTKTQDGAISALLLNKGIIPPAKDKDAISKKNYAGGYLFCPRAGIFKYMFDEDLTSLYPSIIMSLNLGRETMIGRIIDADDRNNRLGLGDLLKLPLDREIEIENTQRKRTKITVNELITFIKENHWTISANGVFFTSKQKSILAETLEGWFDERVKFKNKMKKAYKEGDKEMGAYYHLRQYTLKILLNSTYGALAVPSFRYGNVLLAEATTLTGQRIIQESAYIANKHMNEVIKGKIPKEQFLNELN